MRVQELETEALKLSAAEREELVRRLLSGLSGTSSADPLLALGTNPVECGAPDASGEHDRYLYRSAD
jgi:hypothetical protein